MKRKGRGRERGGEEKERSSNRTDVDKRQNRRSEFSKQVHTPKQVDLDRSNVYSSLVLTFTRSLLGYISTFIDLK